MKCFQYVFSHEVYTAEPKVQSSFRIWSITPQISEHTLFFSNKQTLLQFLHLSIGDLCKNKGGGAGDLAPIIG